MQIAFATPSSTPFNPAAAALLAAVDLSWHDLTPHRSYLVQFARRRLLDPALAEDLVHDVFEAVVTGRATFNGRSALRSWLVAILKHKIVDLIRQRSGHDSLDADGDDGNDHGTPELVCPQPGPAEQAEQRQLLRQLLVRVDALPETLKRVVELRFFQDAESGDICSALQISEQNLFVRLHRARKALAA
jgi:RNA polymerase sigma-70 factor (ECF subfamily)